MSDLPTSDSPNVPQGPLNHAGFETVFDSEADTLEWSQIDPKTNGDIIRKIEKTYDVDEGQIFAIIEHMEPTEVWVRMGEEIRFVWQTGDLRQALYFIQFRHCTMPKGFRFYFSIDLGEKHISSFWFQGANFWCHPKFGSRPPRIIVVEDLDTCPASYRILIGIFLNGHGRYTGINFRSNEVWVG